MSGTSIYLLLLCDFKSTRSAFHLGQHKQFLFHIFFLSPCLTLHFEPKPNAWDSKVPIIKTHPGKILICFRWKFLWCGWCLVSRYQIRRKTEVMYCWYCPILPHVCKDNRLWNNSSRYSKKILASISSCKVQCFEKYLRIKQGQKKWGEQS